MSNGNWLIDGSHPWENHTISLYCHGCLKSVQPTFFCYFCNMAACEKHCINYGSGLPKICDGCQEKIRYLNQLDNVFEMKIFEQFMDVYCQKIIIEWINSDEIRRKEINEAVKVATELIKGIGSNGGLK